LQANSKNRSKFVPDFFVPNQLSGLEQFPHAPNILLLQNKPNSTLAHSTHILRYS